MTGEEFQKLVLEKLTSLEQGQSRLEQGQMNLEQRQVALEQRQAALEQGQSRFTERIDVVETTLTERINVVEATLTKRIDRVESTLTERINMVESTLTTKIDVLDAKVEKYGQSQQDDVKGLLELMDKKLDRISTNQIIQGESVNILALRQLQIEAEIAALKKAK